jgi:hypothetical protein
MCYLRFISWYETFHKIIMNCYDVLRKTYFKMLIIYLILVWIFGIYVIDILLFKRKKEKRFWKKKTKKTKTLPLPTIGWIQVVCQHIFHLHAGPLLFSPRVDPHVMLFLRLFSSPAVRNSHLRLLNRRQHANRSPTAPTLPRPRRSRSYARRVAPRPGRPRAASHVAQPRPRPYTIAVPSSPSCLAGDVPEPHPSLADPAVPSLRHRVLEPVHCHPFTQGRRQPTHLFSKSYFESCDLSL